MSFSYCRSFFILLTLCFAFLHANNHKSAETSRWFIENPQPLEPLKITHVEGWVSPPDDRNNFWCSCVICELNNGLRGEKLDFFITEEEAQSEVEYQVARLTTCTGQVSVGNGPSYDDDLTTVSGKNQHDLTVEDHQRANRCPFRLILNDQGDDWPMRLSIQLAKKVGYGYLIVSLDHLPTLVSIQEQKTAINHWLSTEYKYSYLLTFSNGTIWEASGRPTKQKKGGWSPHFFFLEREGNDTPYIINVSENHCVTSINHEDTMNHYFETIKRL